MIYTKRGWCSTK